jgi:hypothetical protein
VLLIAHSARLVHRADRIISLDADARPFVPTRESA